MILSTPINTPIFGITTNPDNSNVYVEKISEDEISELLKEDTDELKEVNNEYNSKDFKNSDAVENESKNEDSSSKFNKQYKTIQVKINGLNYFKPIYLKPVKDNQYSIVLFDKLYEYGDVHLLVVPHRNGDVEYEFKKEITFDDIINHNSDTYISLEDNTEYLYNIFITDDNENVVSTHYGLITIKNGNFKYSTEYISDEKTIQTESKVSTESSINIQGTVYTNSIYEEEPNNSTSQADTIYSGRDVYGRIGSSSDEDYYKITFTNSGTANFWLGDIYKNCDYDLYVYNNSGTLLWSSTNGGQSQELISQSVSKATYYVKVKPYSTKYNWEYYYFLRVRLSSDTSSGIAWPTSDTYINYCYMTCKLYPNHRGLDIRGTNANPIVAIASGTASAVYNATEHPSYGKAVFINHDMDNPNSTGSDDKKWQSRYAHMIEVLVNQGDVVSRGKILGYIGETGEADGEHLHFETLVGPSFTSLATVNPTTYYPGNQQCGKCGNILARVGLNEITDKYMIESHVTDNKAEGNTAGIYINDEYILDLEALTQMSPDLLEKYGVTKESIDLLIKTMQEENIEDDEFKMYINKLNTKSEQL